MKKAIVLLSGGMDSLYTAAVAVKQCEELYFLHFNYGQRTQARELKSFQEISAYYHARESRVVDYNWLREIGGSALVNSELQIQEYADGIPNTYVPFRNATMLCAAVAWAEVLQAQRIYIGAVEGDSSGYPDCRQVFFDAMTELIRTGTRAANIHIHTPALNLSKREIIMQGMDLGAPFQLSWSCYVSEDLACGECPSCLLRLKAFQEAGITDPIKYRSKE